MGWQDVIAIGIAVVAVLAVARTLRRMFAGSCGCGSTGAACSSKRSAGGADYGIKRTPLVQLQAERRPADSSVAEPRA